MTDRETLKNVVERGRHLESITRADHPFQAPEGQPWARCVECGLGESAHVDTVSPYRTRRGEP